MLFNTKDCVGPRADIVVLKRRKICCCSGFEPRTVQSFSDLYALIIYHIQAAAERISPYNPAFDKYSERQEENQSVRICA
jgi:hypothetical protein